MVVDPHATLERVCAFAGLQADDAVEAMISGERRRAASARHRTGHDRRDRALARAARPARSRARRAATAPVLGRFGYLPTDGHPADPAPRQMRN
jgi:hypothetical protein